MRLPYPSADDKERFTVERSLGMDVRTYILVDDLKEIPGLVAVLNSLWQVHPKPKFEGLSDGRTRSSSQQAKATGGSRTAPHRITSTTREKLHVPVSSRHSSPAKQAFAPLLLWPPALSCGSAQTVVSRCRRTPPLGCNRLP
eukprot:1312540-Pyramimonas_sp.AAC.2